MPGGRPPKPTALKILQGNAGKRRLNRQEPKPIPAAPSSAPAYLKGTAKAEWDRVAPECARLGILTLLDVTKLAAYCEAFAAWRSYEGLCKSAGPAAAIAHGYRNAGNKAAALMRALASDFGFDPSSRSKVHAAPADGESKLKRFLVPVK